MGVLRIFGYLQDNYSTLNLTEAQWTDEIDHNSHGCVSTEGSYFLETVSEEFAEIWTSIATYFFCISDDVQEAYNLIKDLEPATPQVIKNMLYFC